MCTENLVRIELVIESLPLAGMIALIFLALNPLAAIVKSKRRLEAENAALRQQLIVLQRKVLRSFLEQGCPDTASGSADRAYCVSCARRRAPPSIRPNLSFRDTQELLRRGAPEDDDLLTQGQLLGFK